MADLFPYQQEGIEWLKSKRFAYLADEMGLGKSAQLIRALDAVNARRVAIVCPAVVRFHWRDELTKWSISSRSTSIITHSQSDFSGDTLICSYDLVTKNANRYRASYDVVILDEAHYLKNPEAERTRQIFGEKGFARQARYVWLASATPTPNHLGEIWLPLKVGGKTDLEYAAFLTRFTTGYFRSNRYHPTGNTKSQDDMAWLRRSASGIFLRRTKKEVGAQIPGIFYGHVSVPAAISEVAIATEWEGYRTLCRNPEEVAGVRYTGEAGVAAYRRQIGLAKVQAVKELVEAELEAGAYSKIVIFAIHRDVVQQLADGLKKWGSVMVRGDTPALARHDAVIRFQTNPNCRVYVGNIQASGVGISLTAAHHVLMVEPDWVPGNNAQAIMRCHRYGQSQPVTVRFVQLADDELDRKIQAVLRRKTRELSDFYGDKT